MQEGAAAQPVPLQLLPFSSPPSPDMEPTRAQGPGLDLRGLWMSVFGEGWSAPISVCPPRGAAQGRAGSTLTPGGIPCSPWMDTAGAVRGHYTQTKESLHFKGLGLQRCFRTKMCAGFRDGGRALALLCS